MTPDVADYMKFHSTDFTVFNRTGISAKDLGALLHQLPSPQPGFGEIVLGITHANYIPGSSGQLIVTNGRLIVDYLKVDHYDALSSVKSLGQIKTFSFKFPHSSSDFKNMFQSGREFKIFLQNMDVYIDGNECSYFITQCNIGYAPVKVPLYHTSLFETVIGRATLEAKATNPDDESSDYSVALRIHKSYRTNQKVKLLVKLIGFK